VVTAATATITAAASAATVTAVTTAVASATAEAAVVTAEAATVVTAVMAAARLTGAGLTVVVLAVAEIPAAAREPGPAPYRSHEQVGEQPHGHDENRDGDDEIQRPGVEEAHRPSPFRRGQRGRQHLYPGRLVPESPQRLPDALIVA
jgi:ABC-type nickel/cobalt efflux system permease component RcnA